MKYLINEEKNWGDEYDVRFLEILDEADKRIFMAAKKVYNNWYSSYYFGTNEGWEDDFDYLNFNLIELTEEEAAVLKKFNIQCESVFKVLLDMLFDEAVDLGFAPKGYENEQAFIDKLRSMTEQELEVFFTKMHNEAYQ